jgi:hypothetical protein
MHGVGGKEQQRPATANSCAADKPVSLLAFKPDAAAEHYARYRVDEGDSFSIAHGNQGYAAEEREAEYQQDNANLGEEIHAQNFFKRQRGAQALGDSFARRHRFE